MLIIKGINLSPIIFYRVINPFNTSNRVLGIKTPLKAGLLVYFIYMYASTGVLSFSYHPHDSCRGFIASSSPVISNTAVDGLSL